MVFSMMLLSLTLHKFNVYICAVQRLLWMISGEDWIMEDFRLIWFQHHIHSSQYFAVLQYLWEDHVSSPLRCKLECRSLKLALARRDCIFMGPVPVVNWSYLSHSLVHIAPLQGMFFVMQGILPHLLPALQYSVLDAVAWTWEGDTRT